MKTNPFLASILCVSASLSFSSHAAKPAESKTEQGAATRVVKAMDRQTAIQILEDIRLLDACVDQWAIENNKQAGAMATPQELSFYLKRGTRLHTELSAGRLNDAIGNPMILRGVDSVPLISQKTFEQFSTVVKPEFWAPFYGNPAPAAEAQPAIAPAPPAAPINPVTKAEMKEAAVGLLEEMRLIDAAMDQWAIENNKPDGAQPAVRDILPYIKPGLRIHKELSAGRQNDALGNPITIPALGKSPTISKATAEKLSTVTPEDFWGPFFAK